MQRRKLLGFLGTGSVAALAGCGSLSAATGQSDDCTDDEKDSPSPVAKVTDQPDECTNDEGDAPHSPAPTTDQPDECTNDEGDAPISLVETGDMPVDVRTCAFTDSYPSNDKPEAELVVGTRAGDDIGHHEVTISNETEHSHDVSLSVTSGGGESTLVVEADGVLAADNSNPDDGSPYLDVVFWESGEYSFRLEASNDEETLAESFTISADQMSRQGTQHIVKVRDGEIDAQAGSLR